MARLCYKKEPIVVARGKTAIITDATGQDGAYWHSSCSISVFGVLSKQAHSARPPLFISAACVWLSKLFIPRLAINYQEAYGMDVVSCILFNHESSFGAVNL